MASLSVAIRPKRSKAGKQLVAYPVKNAEVVYQGGFYALQAGYVTEPAATAGIVPCGFLSHMGQGCTPSQGLGAPGTSVTGATSPASGMAVPHVVLDEGGCILHSVPVTGLSAQTDLDKPVFLTSDNILADLTSVPVANAYKIGRVDKFIDSTHFDIEIFPKEQIHSVGYITELMEIFTFTTEVLEGTSAINIHTITYPFTFAFISLHAMSQGFDADYVAGSQVLNLEIGGTNVTGGALTLAYTNIDAIGDVGVQIDATAITGANVVAAGTEVQLEMAASGTGFTAVGDEAKAFRVYARIMRL